MVDEQQEPLLRNPVVPPGLRVGVDLPPRISGSPDSIRLIASKMTLCLASSQARGNFFCGEVYGILAWRVPEFQTGWRMSCSMYACMMCSEARHECKGLRLWEFGCRQTRSAAVQQADTELAGDADEDPAGAQPSAHNGFVSAPMPENYEDDDMEDDGPTLRSRYQGALLAIRTGF